MHVLNDWNNFLTSNTISIITVIGGSMVYFLLPAITVSTHFYYTLPNVHAGLLWLVLTRA